MDEKEKALEYYRAAAKNLTPAFVPKRIVLERTVRGDGPFASTTAHAGKYDCESNRYGAVSVRATNGQMLGVLPDEFEVIEWQPNPFWSEEAK